MEPINHSITYHIILSSILINYYNLIFYNEKKNLTYLFLFNNFYFPLISNIIYSKLLFIVSILTNSLNWLYLDKEYLFSQNKTYKLFNFIIKIEKLISVWILYNINTKNYYTIQFLEFNWKFLLHHKNIMHKRK